MSTTPEATVAPEALRIPQDKTRENLFIVIGVGIAVLSLVIFATSLGAYDAAPWRTWASLAGVAVGTATALISLKMRPEHTYALEVDERGITDNTSSTFGAGLISWDDIKAAYRWKVHQGYYLVVDLKDPEGFIERAPEGAAASMTSRLEQHLPLVEIRVAGLPGSYTEDEVLAAIAAYRPKLVKSQRTYVPPKKKKR